jgi:hypothetical protein
MDTKKKSVYPGTASIWEKFQTSLISANWLIYILENHNDFHNSASAASSNIFW